MRNIEFDKTAFEWSYYGKLQDEVQAQSPPSVLQSRLRRSGRGCATAGSRSIPAGTPAPRQVATPDRILADFPTGIIAENVQRYMYTEAEKRKDKPLEVDRYEFLVYRLLRNALEAGNVYVRDSNEFRSFEDDLIRAERWKDKDAVLARDWRANSAGTDRRDSRRPSMRNSKTSSNASTGALRTATTNTSRSPAPATNAAGR